VPGEEISTPGLLFADYLTMASFTSYEKFISYRDNVKFGITDIT